MDKNEKITKYINIITSLIFVALLCIIKNKVILKNGYNLDKNSTDDEVCVFIQESCIHCHDLKKYCETIDISKYNVKFYDIRDKKNLDLLLKYANKHHLSFMELGTPAIFSKREYMIGFDLEDKDEEKFIEFLDKTREEKKMANKQKDMVNIPLLGNFDKTKLSLNKLLFLSLWSYFFSLNNLYSLLFIAVIFLIINIKNKKLVILSYFLFLAFTKFLFLTSFINIFLFIKFIKILLIVLGYYTIYKAIDGITNPNSNGYKYSENEEKLSTKRVLFITLLTFLAASVEFIKPTKVMNIYTNTINQPTVSSAGYILHSAVYTFFVTVLSFLVFCLCYFLFKKFELFKNNLAIIGNLSLLLMGIFIIFI